MTFKPTKNPSYYKLFLYSTFQNSRCHLGENDTLNIYTTYKHFSTLYHLSISRIQRP